MNIDSRGEEDDAGITLQERGGSIAVDPLRKIYHNKR